MTKKINGFEEYEIDSCGNIFSNKRHKYLTQSFDNKGYKRCWLYKDGVRYGFKVHRLVATTFLGEHADQQVNHKDGIKTNNNIKNLEFVTQKQNMRHAFDLGLKRNAIGSEHARTKLSENNVIEIRLLRKAGCREKDIAKEYGIHRCVVGAIVHRRNWKHI